MKEQHYILLTTIIAAWLVAGTLDLTAAVTQTILMGRDPLKMLQYISSGIFGKDAFTGGITYSLLGIILHYFIAFVWTVLFFLVYPKMEWLSKNWVVTGILYGSFVWLIMNRIVVPLSRIPEGPFNLKNALIGLVIIIVAVGLPLSFMAYRYYKNLRDD